MDQFQILQDGVLFTHSMEAVEQEGAAASCSESVRRQAAHLQLLSEVTDSSHLRQDHTGPNVGHLKRLGRLRRVRGQICSVCSAVLEASGTMQMLSGQI